MGGWWVFLTPVGLCMWLRRERGRKGGRKWQWRIKLFFICLLWNLFYLLQKLPYICEKFHISTTWNNRKVS
jgi:uncharacterized membrane protein